MSRGGRLGRPDGKVGRSVRGGQGHLQRKWPTLARCEGEGDGCYDHRDHSSSEMGYGEGKDAQGFVREIRGEGKGPVLC